MPARLAIIGCCASRDWVLSQRRGAARLIAERPHFHSAALAVQFLPAPPDLPEIAPDLSRSDTAVVRRDLTRSWRTEMEAIRPDVVLVDLCYEAAESLVHWRGGWMTRSVSLRNSTEMSAGLPDPIGPDNAPEEFESVVTPAFASFAAFMAKSLPQTRIVLHPVRYAMRYRGALGLVRDFEPEIRASNLRKNISLAAVERIFQKEVAGCERLALPETEPLAELRHRWGLHPIHFDENYYRRFLVAFRRHLGLSYAGNAVQDRLGDSMSELRRRWSSGIRPRSDA